MNAMVLSQYHQCFQQIRAIIMVVVTMAATMVATMAAIMEAAMEVLRQDAQRAMVIMMDQCLFQIL